MTWLPLSILALFLFSFYEIYARITGVQSQNPRVYSVVYNLTATFLAIPFIFLAPIPNLHLPARIIIFLILDLTSWAVFGRLEYYTHKEVEASTLAVVLKMAPAITFILSLIFFHEAATTSKILGLVCLVSANLILLVGNKHQIINQKGLKYAIGLALILGLSWTLDKFVSPFFGVFLFSAISFGSPAIVNSLTPPVKRSEIDLELRHTRLTQIIVTALFNLLGYFCFIQALIIGQASKVTPIATTTTPLVMILGIVFLHEKGNLGKKIFAGALIVLGIWLLR